MSDPRFHCSWLKANAAAAAAASVGCRQHSMLYTHYEFGNSFVRASQATVIACNEARDAPWVYTLFQYTPKVDVGYMLGYPKEET